MFIDRDRTNESFEEVENQLIDELQYFTEKCEVKDNHTIASLMQILFEWDKHRFIETIWKPLTLFMFNSEHHQVECVLQDLSTVSHIFLWINLNMNAILTHRSILVFDLKLVSTAPDEIGRELVQYVIQSFIHFIDSKNFGNNKKSSITEAVAIQEAISVLFTIVSRTSISCRSLIFKELIMQKPDSDKTIRKALLLGS